MHTSVLLQEVLDGLALKGGETVLDATVGGAGHSKEICDLLGSGGHLIGIDADESLVAAARSALAHCNCRVDIHVGNFRHLDTILAQNNVDRLDRALFDLGVSSMHFESLGRGFSFQLDEPLLMTLGEKGKDDLSAYDVVNYWEEINLADIIYGFGGERSARQIAKAIVLARKKKPIETSGELAAIIEGRIRRRGEIHPATKTFQAIRIAVNDELGAIKEALPKVWRFLTPGGRLAVISFHELEDRITKMFFKEKKNQKEGVLLTKKPITPGRAEIKINPRSRSAKLRIIEKQ